MRAIPAWRTDRWAKGALGKQWGLAGTGVMGEAVATGTAGGGFVGCWFQVTVSELEVKMSELQATLKQRSKDAQSSEVVKLNTLMLQ